MCLGIGVWSIIGGGMRRKIKSYGNVKVKEKWINVTVFRAAYME